MVRKEIEKHTLYDRRWVSTVTQVEETPYVYDESLSFNPEEIFVSDDTADGKTPLYTREQMLQMFHFGYETKKYGPYRILRKMRVGDTAIFPYDTWNVLRNVVHKLKKDESKIFSIKKLAPFGKKGDIRIIRES